MIPSEIGAKYNISGLNSKKTKNKIDEVPRGIDGEKSRKDTAIGA